MLAFLGVGSMGTQEPPGTGDSLARDSWDLQLFPPFLLCLLFLGVCISNISSLSQLFFSPDR